MWEFLTNLLWSSWFDYFSYKREIQLVKFSSLHEDGSFLLKAIDGSCTNDEHDFLHKNYHGDIEVDYLEAGK